MKRLQKCDTSHLDRSLTCSLPCCLFSLCHKHCQCSRPTVLIAWVTQWKQCGKEPSQSGWNRQHEREINCVGWKSWDFWVIMQPSFPGGQRMVVKDTWVWSLGWEDPPEKERATHSSILASEIPQTEEPGRLQSMGWQKCQTCLSDWPTAGG